MIPHVAARAERALVAELRRSLVDRNLVPPEGRILVAVSGGPDSTALARALATLSGEAPRKKSSPPHPQLTGLAHLHHGLRGAAADGDRDTCAAMATDLDLPLIEHRLAAGAVAAAVRDHGRGSLESAARRIRYRWLDEVAQEAGATHVAVGHTASDQAETVLFRILRGTGLAGLRGMPRRRRLHPDSSVWLVRPLLTVFRREIEAYLGALGVEARHDASNDDPRFLRARIRKRLLPLLREEFNPRVEQALLRLAKTARRHWRSSKRSARQVLGGDDYALQKAHAAGRELALPVAPLRQATPAVRDTAPMMLLSAISPDRAQTHAVEALAKLIEPDKGPRRRGPGVSLPGGIRAERRAAARAGES